MSRNYDACRADDGDPGRRPGSRAAAPGPGARRRATVFASPLTPEEALDVVDDLLAQPDVTVVHPGPRHAALLRELLAGVGTAGNLTTDAHLAALAREHGATLCSRDADFSRFPGLRWQDPLR